MYKCSKCGLQFVSKQALGGHISSNKGNDICKTRKIIEYKKACKYCGKEFDNPKKSGGHTAFCIKNPNYQKRVNSISFRNKNRTTESLEKLSNSIRKTVNEKIKQGTWHNSFSRSRIHEYNGQKFYGGWEVNYAKWLDENNIKWRKVKETFRYNFEGKERRYTPDFYLIDEQCYIEIKGYETEKDRAKWRDFPLKLKVLKGEELKELGIIKEFRKI